MDAGTLFETDVPADTQWLAGSPQSPHLLLGSSAGASWITTQAAAPPRAAAPDLDGMNRTTSRSWTAPATCSAKQMGGQGWDQVTHIDVDGAGTVYATGWFEDTADFDPGQSGTSLTALGEHDIFISKHDRAGALFWVQHLGGTSFETGFGIAVDGSGNVHATGLFVGTVDFDPGPQTANRTATGPHDCLAIKLDATGDLAWVQQFGGTSWTGGHDIAVDGSGNVYLSTVSQGLADFDPGPAVLSLASAGGTDTVIVKLDRVGSLVWARQISGPDMVGVLDGATPFLTPPLPLGILTVGSAATSVFFAALPVGAPLNVGLPSAPALAGLEFAIQAAGAPAAFPERGNFTNRYRAVLFP
ncbi:MAG: SBBP repeat-containing protein [Planctomycetota bacterium]